MLHDKGSQSEVKWATPFEIHTPSVEDLEKLSTVGVCIINGLSAKWMLLPEIHTPSVVEVIQ